jgi:hypothetical protein
MFRKENELEQHEDDLSSNLLEIFSRAKITWNLRSKRCSSGRFLRFRRGPSFWRQAPSIGFYKPIVTMTAGTAWSLNCRNIFIVGRLTRSLPLSRPDGLPVYVARVPAAPFCEPRKRSALAQAPTICQEVKRRLGEKHEH